MGERALDAALRIRDRIVGSAKGGTRGVYLCHGFCEVGAIPIDLGFTEIRDFVEANPDEVVTVVIEDYVPPGDIAAAAERTGLIDFVYEGPRRRTMADPSADDRLRRARSDDGRERG